MARDLDRLDHFDYNRARRFTPGQRTHGTISCYHWELRKGIPPCDDCREAGRIARAAARAARRARGERVT